MKEHLGKYLVLAVAVSFVLLEFNLWRHQSKDLIYPGLGIDTVIAVFGAALKRGGAHRATPISFIERTKKIRELCYRW